jgi:hypothetical protein
MRFAIRRVLGGNDQGGFVAEDIREREWRQLRKEEVRGKG